MKRIQFLATMKFLIVGSIFNLIFALACFSQQSNANDIFQISELFPKPVISNNSKRAESNIYGFEGGRVIKFKNQYHLFTTEMCSYPVWTKTKLAHWRSKDGVVWDRLSTLAESSGNFDGTDTHACLWSPMPTFDNEINKWCITYVAFRSKPNSDEAWYRNYDGRIVLAYSEHNGKSGIYGPYKEQEIIMELGSESAKWEG